MLAQFYPPIVGGAELHVRSLSTELARRGHEVTVVTLWHKGLAPYELDAGVRVIRAPGMVQRAAWLFGDHQKRPAMPFPDPTIVQALRRVLRSFRPQIVHAHNWLLHSFLPLKDWSGAGLVVTLHDFGLICAKQTFLHRGANCSGPGFMKCLECAGRHYGAGKGFATALANWGMGVLERDLVDVFLPVSADVAAGNDLIGSGLKFQVIPNFVSDDVNRQQVDVRNYVKQLPEDGYLLFVGGFSRSKGIEVLLRAYADLESVPPLVLLGYRTPESTAILRRLPNNVLPFESWPHAAVMETWRRSLFGVVPSVWREPCPTVVIEAMAAGKPVIASRIGGIPDLIEDGTSGILVPPSDAPELRRAIVRMLGDQVLRRQLQEGAERRAPQFQSSAVVPQVEAVYRELAGPGSFATASL